MWPSCIIKEDFLDQEDLDILSRGQWNTLEAGWDIMKNKIVDGRLAESTVRHGGMPPKGLPSGTELLNIYNKYQVEMLGMLSELAPEKVLKLQFTELNLVSTGKNYVYPIHNDTYDKLLSVVIYIAPELNTGTILYDTATGDNSREVEWKRNRAFAFSRTEETWHSYQSNGITNRVALVYNLRGS